MEARACSCSGQKARGRTSHILELRLQLQRTLERAKDDWKSGRFARIPGDDVEFIPLPER